MAAQNKETGSFARSALKVSVLIFIIAGALVFITIPHVVAPVAQNLLLEKARSIPDLGRFDLDIQSIGLSGIGIGNITTGDSISIDSLFCGYSPLSLVKKSISSLDISGLEIKGVIDDTDPLFADFSPSSAKSDNGEDSRVKKESRIRHLASILPFLPPVIAIKHSFLTMKYQNSIMSIPFSLIAEIDHKNYHINLILTLLPMGQKVKISIDADIRNIAGSQNQSRIKTLFRSVVLDAYNVSWSHVNELIYIFAPEADIKLTGKSDVTLLMDSDISKWRLNVSHIGIKEPLDGEINNIVLNLALNDFEKLFGQRADKSEPVQSSSPSLYPAVAAEGSFWFGSDMVSPVNVIYGITVNNDKKWSFSLKGREMWPRKTFTIGDRDSVLRVNAPDIEIDCNGEGGSTDGIVKMTMGRLISEKQDIALESVKFQLPFKYGDNIKYGENGKKTQKKEISKYGTKGYFNIDAIQYKGRKIASLDSSVSMLPAGKNSKKDAGVSMGITVDGKINIDDLTGIPVKSKIGMLKDSGLMADLSYQLDPTTVTPDLVRKIYLFSDGQKFSADAAGKAKKRTEYTGKDSENAGNGTDIMSGMDFSFRIASNGWFAFRDHQMDSHLNLDLSDGTFSMPEKKINLSGISTSVVFNELPSMRSVAGQVLTIEKIDIKDLEISNARVKYTIESNKKSVSGKERLPTKGKSEYIPALLVENASFNWCDGKVISDSIRFSSSDSNYHMSLFCDRLKLSSILQQVGAFDAEGEGTLNGRIPVSFSGGDISFDNGFLYSTPGQGGKIKVLGTEKLTAGIPMDTPQFSQVDLAREALKNYRYEWARLGFDTQGDQLVVKMEFDGKPENALPFVYKKDLGSFVRVSGKNAGSHFQGIKIDLNLQLPFNRVLRFGNQMNNLFK
ncbi:MAG: YdbH domain-containing protein [Desulfamplus sp.]|nr:YdbH domain-containing protein [Desulfamplus sp.]